MCAIKSGFFHNAKLLWKLRKEWISMSVRITRLENFHNARLD